MDSVSTEKRSSIMRAVKSKETSLEKTVKGLLREHKLHFRFNNKGLVGKPDFSLKNKKIVIFIDSCFWHGCSEHLRRPHSNTDYWEKKIERNTNRDKAVTEYYKTQKWTVLRIWEHQLKTNPEEIVTEIKRIVSQRGKDEN